MTREIALQCVADSFGVQIRTLLDQQRGEPPFPRHLCRCSSYPRLRICCLCWYRSTILHQTGSGPTDASGSSRVMSFPPLTRLPGWRGSADPRMNLPRKSGSCSPSISGSASKPSALFSGACWPSNNAHPVGIRLSGPRNATTVPTGNVQARAGRDSWHCWQAEWCRRRQAALADAPANPSPKREAAAGPRDYYQKRFVSVVPNDCLQRVEHLLLLLLRWVFPLKLMTRMPLTSDQWWSRPARARSQSTHRSGIRRPKRVGRARDWRQMPVRLPVGPPAPRSTLMTRPFPLCAVGQCRAG